jgi:hypothetical protein
MRYAAFDRHGVWLFDFITDTEDRHMALREAQEEDPEVASVHLEEET